MICNVNVGNETESELPDSPRESDPLASSDEESPLSNKFSINVSVRVPSPDLDTFMTLQDIRRLGIIYFVTLPF